jgi:hypothetical protein
MTKTMNKFEEAGRQHVINQIDELEASIPGLNPMFYFTLGFESDIEAASQLRQTYGMPRPAEIEANISGLRTRYAALEAKAQAYRDHHEHMMQTDWFYWICRKLGIKWRMK